LLLIGKSKILRGDGKVLKLKKSQSKDSTAYWNAFIKPGKGSFNCRKAIIHLDYYFVCRGLRNLKQTATVTRY